MSTENTEQLPKVKKELSPKTKKIINIVVDVVVAVVLALALFLAICTISSRKKGYEQYTEVFGKAYLAVQSDSMKGDKEDNFAYGDLITIKIAKDNDAKDLKEGQIISFKDRTIVNGKYVLNTHRIKEIAKNTDGSVKHYVTHGDNNPENMTEIVLPSEVVGIYQGKAGGIGHVFLFMSTSAGFFVCVVLPTLLIVVYFAVNLVLVILREKKLQTVQAVQAQADEEERLRAEKERIRQELLAEMQASPPQAPATDDVSKEEKKSDDDKQ